MFERHVVCDPADAYATAPSITREIAWTADAAAHRPFGATGGREFWLRKAALLDRIALTNHAPADANELADNAARHLAALDGSTDTDHPRTYLRQQYAEWADTE